MRKLTACFCLAALALGAHAQEFTESFSTGAFPAGWTADSSFNYGNRDFANSRANIYATDAGTRLFHPLTVPASAAKVVVTFDGNLASSGIGETNWIEARMTDGATFIVHHGYGDWTRDTGFNAGTMVESYNLADPSGTYVRLADQRVAKVFGNYSYVVTFEDGKITQFVYRNNTLFSQQTVSAPALHIQEFNQIGFGLYTTTEASLWVDNFTVAFSDVGAPPPLASFVDLFDGTSIDFTHWQIIHGSWSVANGQLFASWDPSVPAPHGSMLLVDQDINADYDATFTAVLSNGATRFRLYLNDASQYSIDIGQTGMDVERTASNGWFTNIITSKSLSGISGTTPSVVLLQRRGNTFYITVEGQTMSFVDDVWNGAMRLGLGVYNSAVFDEFSYSTTLKPIGQLPDTDCAALQQALNDALAALAAANAQVTTLTQQLAAANADKASLQAQLIRSRRRSSAFPHRFNNCSNNWRWRPAV